MHMHTYRDRSTKGRKKKRLAPGQLTRLLFSAQMERTVPVSPLAIALNILSMPLVPLTVPPAPLGEVPAATLTPAIWAMNCIRFR